MDGTETGADSFPTIEAKKEWQLKERWRKALAGYYRDQAGFEELDEVLWPVLARYQGKDFLTAKGLQFSYTIRGNEMFVSRKEKSITRATVNIAFHVALAIQKGGMRVTGPKKLKTFGASYLYPVFIKIGIIRTKEEMEELLSSTNPE